MNDKPVSRRSFCLRLVACLLALPALTLAQTGDKHALLLVPITYTEVAPASGFDGLTQPHWLMVPQYGNNFARAITPASGTFPISFFVKPDSAVDSVLPVATSTSPQTITVHGETLGDVHQVAIGVGTKVGRGAELNVTVKVLKTVKVALHAITLQRGDYYGPTPNAPNAQEAQNYLNQVYGLQTNTYFTVTRKDYALEYDIGGGSNAAVNGKFDFSVIQPYTPEQMVIENSDAKNNSDDYNIYFFHEYVDKYGKTSVGHALTDIKSAYIKDYSGKTAVVTVLAHELGHLFGITWHSDFKDEYIFNKWYLPYTDPSVRLMHSTINGLISDPKILIKAEWDTINP